MKICVKLFCFFPVEEGIAWKLYPGDEGEGDEDV